MNCGRLFSIANASGTIQGHRFINLAAKCLPWHRVLGESGLLGWPWAAPLRWEPQTSPAPSCGCLLPDLIKHPPNPPPPSSILVVDEVDDRLTVGSAAGWRLLRTLCIFQNKASVFCSSSARLGSDQLGSALLAHLTCPVPSSLSTRGSAVPQHPLLNSHSVPQS